MKKGPLRHDLQAAIHQREASLRNGRCQRKDHDQIRVSIGRAQVFLNGYPFATDQQVRDWCKGHVEDLTRIVPGNSPKLLARLLMDELRDRSEPVTPAA